MRNPDNPSNAEPTGRKERLLQCSACGDYINPKEVFSCPQCKKGPLCRRHRLPGRKECISCTIEVKLHEVKALQGQERNIRQFIRFLQFVFLLCAILFIAIRLGLSEAIDVLKHNFITENIAYIGIAAVLIAIVFYVLKFIQTQRITELESEIEKIRAKM
jgi:hypothetical protein